MKRASTLWFFLVAVSVSAAGLLALEWSARYREEHRTTVPGTTPFIYYRHSRLGHAFVRGINYYGWVHIDREGFRGAEVTVVPPAGVTRIMAIGSSTTMDGEVSRDERAWPARLQFWLDSLAPGQRFEVINAGVAGYRVIDNLVRFQTELYRYHPSLVVLFGSEQMDLLSALASGGDTQPQPVDPRPDEVATITPWGRWLERHSLLYNKVVEKWRATRAMQQGPGRQRSTSPPDYENRIARGARDYGHDLAALVAMVRMEGIPVVIPQSVYLGAAGTPGPDAERVTEQWRAAVPFAPPAVVLAGYARYDSVTRSVAALRGATFLPTAQPDMGAPELYADGDPVHFNDRGADQMGRVLAATLLRLSPWRVVGGPALGHGNHRAR